MRQSRRVAAVGVPVAAGAAVLALLGAGGGSAPLADPPQPVLTPAGRPVDAFAVDDPAMPHPSVPSQQRAGSSPPQPSAVPTAARAERASRSDNRPTASPQATAGARRAVAAPTSTPAPRRSSSPTPSHHVTATPRPTATTTTKPTTTRPTSTSTTSRDAFVARVLQLVNAQRASHGLRPFTLSSCAGRFAQPWADHLAAAGALSHQSLTTVLTACSAHTAGENVGYTTLGADDLVARWMASAPHRANILNPAFTSIGLGATRAGGRWYGVQDFLG